MNSIRKAVAIGLLVAVSGVQIARAGDFSYGRGAYAPVGDAPDNAALALEQEYTLMYAHDPARPPLVIVNHPPAAGANSVSARY
jgi:hypothetical protein